MQVVSSRIRLWFMIRSIGNYFPLIPINARQTGDNSSIEITFYGVVCFCLIDSPCVCNFGLPEGLERSKHVFLFSTFPS